MRIVPFLSVRGGLLATLALTADPLGSVADGFGRMAQAQQIKELQMPKEQFERAEIERLFREYERLMGRKATPPRAANRPACAGISGRRMTFGDCSGARIFNETPALPIAQRRRYQA